MLRETTAQLREAADLFRRAADNGIGDASYQLGRLYQQGLGIPLDPVAAFENFLAAADGSLVHPTAGEKASGEALRRVNRVDILGLRFGTILNRPVPFDDKMTMITSKSDSLPIDFLSPFRAIYVTADSGYIYCYRFLGGHVLQMRQRHRTARFVTEMWNRMASKIVPPAAPPRGPTQARGGGRGSWLAADAAISMVKGRAAGNLLPFRSPTTYSRACLSLAPVPR